MDKMNVPYDNMSLAERIEVDAPRIGLQGNAEQKLRKAMHDSHKVGSTSIKEKHATKELVANYKNKRGKLISEQITPLRKIFSSLGIEETNVPEPNKEHIELVEVQEVEFPNLKRGVPWALFWSFLGGAGLLGWWYSFASKALGLELGVPTMESLNKMFEWTSAEVGLEPSAQMGAAVVAGIVFIVMFIIYTVVKIIRSFSNLQKAKKVEKETQRYLSDKEREIEETSKIKAHVEKLDSTISSIKILLAELKAKIERALHLENVTDYESLHDNSKADIKNAEFILGTTDKLLAVPVAISGSVNNRSVEMLKETESAVEEYIDKLYKSPKQKPFMSDNLAIDTQECEDLK